MLSSWLKLYFLSGMVLGIWVVITSNSWLMAWFGLEMNLICFMPFLMKEYKAHGNASSVYFLAQAAGSLVVLMFGVSFWYFEGFKFWVNIALLLKVGAAPFHFWYIQVASVMKWIYFLVLSTIQKIAPLILLSINSTELFKSEIYFSIIASSVVGGLGGFYTLSLRELLVYSSINHLGWMLVPLISSNLFWMIYFMIYCLLLILVVSMSMVFSIYHLNQLASTSISWSGKVALTISMMSLGGLPPFVGFVPKWGVVLQSSTEMNLLCLSVLIIFSVTSLYYYIRASFSILLINTMSKTMSLGLLKVVSSSVVIFISVVGFWINPLIKLSFLQ